MCRIRIGGYAKESYEMMHEINKILLLLFQEYDFFNTYKS